MQANLLKARLKAGEPSFVFSVRMARTVNIVSLAQGLGYHGIYIDLQHSSMSIDMAAQMFGAALHSEVTAFARPPSLEPGFISRLLDSGAQGILAPDIRSAADASALVKAALISPKGERSVGTGIPNPRFKGLSGGALGAAINDATLLIAMIETEEGVEAAAEIIGVDGIDAIQIGSNDLTTSMGIPGQYTHERVKVAYRKVIEACKAAGKPLIIGGIRKSDELKPYVQMGAARCYFTGADANFVVEGAKMFLGEAKTADAVMTS
ncbi:MAG TPA: aldolase/citrate lyase family protein [Dongiaceae bacterium]|nr:aldolase/citrate lyase family protein [Dongiaceae bacterium]